MILNQPWEEGCEENLSHDLLLGRSFAAAVLIPSSTCCPRWVKAKSLQVHYSEPGILFWVLSSQQKQTVLFSQP
jgi:hypothetical protein